MKPWGVLVAAIGEPAATVHGAGRQIAWFIEQDMQAFYFKTKPNCARVSALFCISHRPAFCFISSELWSICKGGNKLTGHLVTELVSELKVADVSEEHVGSIFRIEQ
jgi:hypothetical protein